MVYGIKSSGERYSFRLRVKGMLFGVDSSYGESFTLIPSRGFLTLPQERTVYHKIQIKHWVNIKWSSLYAWLTRNDVPLMLG